MSKENTLIKVREEIGEGFFEKAISRLHGLIAFYPNDLELRRILGEIYYQIKLPAMAGKYWYLEENKTQIMIDACNKFEKQCGYKTHNIVSTLKFRGNLDDLDSEYAKANLSSLFKECPPKYTYDPSTHSVKKIKTETSSFGDLLRLGCVSVLVSLFALIMLAGISTIIETIWP